jgi:hypothetical protein
MAVSFAYRQSVKRRARRARRSLVVMFFVVMSLGLLEGGAQLATWRDFVNVMLPYFAAFTFIFGKRGWRGAIAVTSLDDRAMAEYGVEFEQTTPAQQKDLLKRYRVGTYLLGYFPDEYEEAQERESHLRAYEIFRFLLPLIAVLYWLGWRLLAEGGVRAAWTNGPVVLTWLTLFVLALPQMLRMWTEPDDQSPAEPKLVDAAQKEARDAEA